MTPYFQYFSEAATRGVLKNFAEFTGKQLCQILSFNEVAGLRPAGLWSQACNFIKRENLEQVFSCEFCEAFKNSFLQNTSGRLLLIFLLDHKLILKSDYAFNNS